MKNIMFSLAVVFSLDLYAYQEDVSVISRPGDPLVVRTSMGSCPSGWATVDGSIVSENLYTVPFGGTTIELTESELVAAHTPPEDASDSDKAAAAAKLATARASTSTVTYRNCAYSPLDD